MTEDAANVFGIAAGLGVVIACGMTVEGVLDRVTGWAIEDWSARRRNKAGVIQVLELTAADLLQGRRDPARSGDRSAALLGCFERLFYFGAFLIGGSPALAGWFALKVASKWQTWTFAKEGASPVEGLNEKELLVIRSDIGYLRFVVGNAANLTYALLGVAIAKWVAGYLSGGIRLA